MPLARTAGLLLAGICLGPGAHAENPVRTDYLLYCSGCHLENGSGMPPEVPDLRVGLDRFNGHPTGRAYLTRVPGVANTPVSDLRISRILNWMMTTFYPTHPHQPFTAGEVAAYRKTRLPDPLEERKRVLATIAADAAPTGQPRQAP